MAPQSTIIALLILATTAPSLSNNIDLVTSVVLTCQGLIKLRHSETSGSLRRHLLIDKTVSTHGLLLNEDCSTLFPAVIQNQHEMVADLIGNTTIDINCNIKGVTALHIAAWCGNLNMVSILLNLGAEMRTTEDSKTPDCIAEERAKEFAIQKNQHEAQKYIYYNIASLIYSHFNSDTD